ncbi:MAG: hypothetical protein SFU86_06175 [Pirellulaceae bacterium]|nr:hypothetical protein [Pirellulaceae bacterium]
MTPRLALLLVALVAAVFSSGCALAGPAAAAASIYAFSQSDMVQNNLPDR